MEETQAEQQFFYYLWFMATFYTFPIKAVVASFKTIFDASGGLVGQFYALLQYTNWKIIERTSAQP